MAKRYYKPHDWVVTQESLEPQQNGLDETVFALANGYMGVRGTAEEGFSGEGTTPGTYLPLVYDHGDIRYDWRRVNFPTKSSFMVNVGAWTPIRFRSAGETFDPLRGKVLEYRRTLDMRRGLLHRRLVWEAPSGRRTEFESVRLASMDRPHVGAIRYAVTPLNYSGRVVLDCGLDAGPSTLAVTGMGAAGRSGAFLCLRTLRSGFDVAMVSRTRLATGGRAVKAAARLIKAPRAIETSLSFQAREGVRYELDKIVGIASSRDPEATEPKGRAAREAGDALRGGFDRLLEAHEARWAALWREHDIVIRTDPAGQQGIRFAVMNLQQNYAGTDERLNIGAKGITGPGYGGLYFWDSEVYLLPYYAWTSPSKARNLLMQRYRTLPQARERAASFGYRGALYPWTTLDGHDCAIPWEYGMLEQHVSVAIPYGTFLYAEASGDEAFLFDYGAEMVVECARFWASRCTWNARRKAYVINCVTGPDEYAMVVNNNCYTNTMAKWTVDYALELMARMRKAAPAKWRALAKRIGLKPSEPAAWRDVSKKMLLPFDRKLGLHPQDDAFLNMDPIDVSRIPESEKPLLNHWPWERLIRHQVLKQPDVLLLMFLLGDRYGRDVKKRNYDYYEPKTVHDSSLSPCIHSILAAELGYDRQAFDYYLRTARLDLDDVNGNASHGIHIANMAGTWMSIACGFAGMRLSRGRLSFDPNLPRAWRELSFQLAFRGRRLQLTLRRDALRFEMTGPPLTVTVSGRPVSLDVKGPVEVRLKR